VSCKHIDILAIAILLLGMALYSNLRTAIPLVMTHKRVTVVEPLHRPLALTPKASRISFALN
jgi:hypothetical protein